MTKHEALGASASRIESKWRPLAQPSVPPRRRPLQESDMFSVEPLESPDIRSIGASYDKSLLEVVFNPEDVDPFTVAFRSQTAWLSSINRIDAFRRIINFPALNDLLRTHAQDARIRMRGAGGSPVSPGQYRVSNGLRGLSESGKHPPQLHARGLLAQLRAGATLVVDGVEQMNANVADVCSAFEGYFREKISRSNSSSRSLPLNDSL